MCQQISVKGQTESDSALTGRELPWQKQLVQHRVIPFLIGRPPTTTRLPISLNRKTQPGLPGQTDGGLGYTRLGIDLLDVTPKHTRLFRGHLSRQCKALSSCLPPSERNNSGTLLGIAVF
jgi:hypothetical protein